MRAFAGSRWQEPPEPLMFSTNSATGVRALLNLASAFSGTSEAIGMALWGDFHLASGAGWSVYWRISHLKGGGLEVWFAERLPHLPPGADPVLHRAPHKRAAAPVRPVEAPSEHHPTYMYMFFYEPPEAESDLIGT